MMVKSASVQGFLSYMMVSYMTAGPLYMQICRYLCRENHALKLRIVQAGNLCYVEANKTKGADPDETDR